VLVGRGALGAFGRVVRAATGARRVALVTDARVDALWGAAARRALASAGVACVTLRVPRGEAAKRPERLARLWDALAEAGIGRRDGVVALGGGSVGDLAGLAAATWLRGVPWVVVPTTLLAQADAALGGKTAVDLGAGKNLAGAFHQPSAVVADPDLLATLPERPYRAGLAEIVKKGMAVDATLFRWIERHAAALAARRSATVEGAVVRALRVKGRVVAADPREREGGPRTALNFGHTAGHAIEAALGYRGLLHGEAVAIGMRVAAALSARAARLGASERARLEALLDGFGLPRRMPPVGIDALFAAIARDKKRGPAGVRWVLTPRIGHASVPRPVDRRVVRAALLEAGARTGRRVRT
jgi:3-dehydroquinate synthase